MIHQGSLARAAAARCAPSSHRCLPRLTAQPLASLHRSYATAAAATSSSSSHSSYASSILSPAVMFIVHSQHVDPASITGSGRAGRLLKSDVLAALKAGTARKVSPEQQQQQQQQAASTATDQHGGVSAVTSAPKVQDGPRVTDSGRRNRSAMFSSTTPPSSPPSTPKLQAIDVSVSKPASAPSGAKPPLAAASLPAHRGRGRSHDDVPLSNIRRVTASRLLQAKQSIPHSYVTAAIDISAVLALRSSLKAPQSVSPSSPPPPVPSLNDFMVRACALALRRHPQVNSTLDKASGSYSPSASVDISVAVATDIGLLTPIVTKADRRRLSDISAAVRELAAKAKAGKLRLDEFQGGSFTISNLGMFGVHAFSAIINAPQAAILAVGGTHDLAKVDKAASLAAAAAQMPLPMSAQALPAVYVPQPAAASPSYSSPAPAAAAAAAPAVAPAGTAAVAAAASSVSSSPLLSVTLVFDERAIDGVEASKFLQTLRALLEQPEQQLM